MRKADGTFLQCARNMAAEYPEIKFEDTYLDTVCLRVSIYSFYLKNIIQLSIPIFDTFFRLFKIPLFTMFSLCLTCTEISFPILELVSSEVSDLPPQETLVLTESLFSNL